MITNDILRSVRYMLDLSDQKVVEIVRLAAADFPVDRADVPGLVCREGEAGFVECSQALLAHFLDGLIVFRRGRDERLPPRPVERHVSNNIVLKKLRVAFALKDTDLIAIFQAAGFAVSRPELSAFFRDRGHPNYRPCGDQMLRNFLRGLTLRLRPPAGAAS
jgi:uncharacterized protein YehS (DUF1456 family)